MISEQEARELSVALSTAMRNNDKDTREMLYKDLSTDDLKRILRWTIRMSIARHVSLIALSASVTGSNPEELDEIIWQQQALAFTSKESES